MSFIVWVLLGLAIGVISGLLGIGGGVLLIPVLMWLASLEQAKAAGVTLAVLSVPVALPAVIEYYRNGSITHKEIWMALWIAVGFAVGGWSGAYLRPTVPVLPLRLCFGLLLLYVAVRFLLATDYEVLNAAIGVFAMIVAWLLYWRLKLLGHKHLTKPTLRITARKLNEHAEGDYYI